VLSAMGKAMYDMTAMVQQVKVVQHEVDRDNAIDRAENEAEEPPV